MHFPTPSAESKQPQLQAAFPEFLFGQPGDHKAVSDMQPSNMRLTRLPQLLFLSSQARDLDVASTRRGGEEAGMGSREAFHYAFFRYV